MWAKLDDGSIVDSDGRLVFCSIDRFLKDIVEGSCCFICGARRKERAFNDEHIIPKWVLKRCGLFDQTITLPNGVSQRYSTYTVPCCVNCNNLLGREIEGPISSAFEKGNDGVNELVRSGDGLKLFIWAALIFLKTHLKDRLLRMHLDPRKGTETISDTVGYGWQELHHLHCLVRSIFSGAVVDHSVLGSLICWPVTPEMTQEDFDFVDLTFAQSILIRIQGTALIVVFNDCGASSARFDHKMKNVTGPMNDLQVREVLASLAHINLGLAKRPEFATLINRAEKWCEITARKPSAVELQPYDGSVRGMLLEKVFEFALENIRVPMMTTEEVITAIRSGDFTVLFDAQGQFIDYVIREE